MRVRRHASSEHYRLTVPKFLYGNFRILNILSNKNLLPYSDKFKGSYFSDYQNNVKLIDWCLGIEKIFNIFQ
jgi:hypothetical protein